MAFAEFLFFSAIAVAMYALLAVKTYLQGREQKKFEQLCSQTRRIPAYGEKK